jgi:hypothetical protein
MLVLAASASYFTRSRHADAAELLRKVKAAWTTVPAMHQVVRITGSGGARTEETWVVRHRGRRQENRTGGDLIGVVVRGERWEFRWDVPRRTVAAWSTDLAPAIPNPRDQGLVFHRTDFEAWAQTLRAELAIEPDMVAGREARRIVLRWPQVGRQETSTVWFDATSLLPLKELSQGADGTVIETTIDYPSPDAVASDLFTFAMPPEILLEVNDPELGRQLYSDPQTREADATHTKGAER